MAFIDPLFLHAIVVLFRVVFVLYRVLDQGADVELQLLTSYVIR